MSTIWPTLPTFSRTSQGPCHWASSLLVVEGSTLQPTFSSLCRAFWSYHFFCTCCAFSRFSLMSSFITSILFCIIRMCDATLSELFPIPSHVSLSTSSSPLGAYPYNSLKGENPMELWGTLLYVNSTYGGSQSLPSSTVVLRIFMVWVNCSTRLSAGGMGLYECVVYVTYSTILSAAVKWN